MLIITLAVVVGIVWVHFLYLPQAVVISAPPTTSPSTPNEVYTEPSPRTADAMREIQYLVQQHLPFLDETPTPLVLTTEAPTESTTFSYLGLTLSVPWKGIKNTIIKGTPTSFVETDFTNGRDITVMRAPTSNAATLAQWASLSSTIKTDYDLDLGAYNATPNEVISSTPEDQAVLIAGLLDVKTSLWIPAGPIYSFNTSRVAGFQHGDATTTTPVAVDFFDQDNHEFTITINGTQPEINYILTSAKTN